jgi:hypothetical protein
VNVTGTLTITGTQRAIINSTSSIAINAIAGMSANGITAGPGGFNGGTAGNDGSGPGNGKMGNNLGQGGGGAGFDGAGTGGGGGGGAGGAATGDVLITSYSGTNPNAGSGGGGASGAGGGGGGTIELTAGGTLSAPAIAANGANGAGGLIATGSGGGSGGVIVLRAFATATLNGALTVNKGMGGSGTTTSGGDGAPGRARVDAAMLTGTLGPAHRGFMFATTAPLIVRTAQPDVAVTGTPGDRFDLHRVTPAIVSIDKTLVDFGGANQLEIEPTNLTPGLNRLCAVPQNASLANAESRNCIDVAYLP